MRAFINKLLSGRSAYLVYSPVPGETPVRARALLSSQRSSVQDDWSASLPQAKAHAFDSCVRQLETVYSMFSVSLNEALEFRRIGKSSQSCSAIFLVPALCVRLALPLEGLLHTLGEHAKHFGIIPNTAPLDAANFRGAREQRSARMSDLLSHVLLTQRSQFLNKIDTLEEMVLNLRKDFSEVAVDLGNGASAQPSSDWRILDDAHFDLNTCLRESIVLLKSFFVVLPTDQLPVFQKSVDSLLLPSTTFHTDPRRRLALIEGE